MWGEGWVGWVGGKSDEGHIERWRKSRDERHDPTHLDGVRGGPLAVDQQHVVWRELDLAIGEGNLKDARALLHSWGRGGVLGYRAVRILLGQK